MKKLLFISLFLISSAALNAQLLKEKPTYTKADTLRGSLRKERNFDVQHYTLDVKVEPEKQYISGSNTIKFIPQEDLETIQIDLFENLQVDSIVYKGKTLPYRREFNAVFIDFSNPLKENTSEEIQFYYSGNPKVAKNAPWDGGFVYKTSESGQPWIATACQGLGASVWWPVKDHQSDEPDHGMDILVSVPNGIMDVSNGRLQGSEDLGDGYTKWHWKVINPINSYDVSLNIGDYVHFGENYKGLDTDFYVLRENLEKAKIQFKEVEPMMDCFQEHFGEYPFKEDSYKLVETPFLGMEHQSAVAYGNKYMKGYLGTDLSGNGPGLKWDYIIIHETGHEWFGNSITSKDIADMWIHEAFTTYTEVVYTECEWGYEDAMKYVYGLRRNIRNNAPIIGDYGVNKEGSGDMYFKGANMLNTLRHVVNDDDKWWKLLKDYSLHFKHQQIETKDVVDFFEAETNLNLKPIFDQYLRYTTIPVLELKKDGKSVLYRWKTDVSNFEMPIDIKINNNQLRINATNDWQKLKKADLDAIKVNTSMNYIKVEKL
ncbi:Peptidase family M1 [Pustulibacterium marinum]|uniref:Peptidase family M1 n=1 Tax=Pustulibacterium marinum TaxID=1224947 RepID=A0A1I7IJH3_9FLAO|nr:M1 family metallopeptidase [Pustulibacterium marinum]SFU73056.1 Peptidase family M1 [Pustulibacterium marinum]